MIFKDTIQPFYDLIIPPYDHGFSHLVAQPAPSALGLE